MAALFCSSGRTAAGRERGVRPVGGNGVKVVLGGILVSADHGTGAVAEEQERNGSSQGGDAAASADRKGEKGRHDRSRQYGKEKSVLARQYTRVEFTLGVTNGDENLVMGSNDGSLHDFQRARQVYTETAFKKKR